MVHCLVYYQYKANLLLGLVGVGDLSVVTGLTLLGGFGKSGSAAGGKSDLFCSAGF